MIIQIHAEFSKIGYSSNFNSLTGKLISQAIQLILEIYDQLKLNKPQRSILINHAHDQLYALMYSLVDDMSLNTTHSHGIKTGTGITTAWAYHFMVVKQIDNCTKCQT